MYAMRLLLLFIALLSSGSPAAQTASLFRFFNPYSWFSYGTQTASLYSFSFTNLTFFIYFFFFRPSVLPVASHYQTSIRHVNTELNASVTIPSTSSFQGRNRTLESNTTIHPSSGLPLVPLSATEKDADGNFRGTIYVQDVVAAASVPISGLEILKHGLVKETEIPEGREDVELQTTTETIESDPPTTKADPVNERNPTTDAKLEVNALSSSTETREPALTVSLETTTSRFEHGSPTDQEQRLSKTKESVQTSTTIASSTVARDPVTSAAPVYVSEEARPFMTFLHAEDFALYLNRNYYAKPVFDGVVGRQTE